MGIAQSAMDKAYERYRRHEGANRFEAPGLTGPEIVATLFGNFNYQSGNGGLFQWWDNSYAFERGPNGASAHVVIAALARRYRDGDPEVADAIVEAMAFIDGLAEIERNPARHTRWSDDDDDEWEEYADPVEEHFHDDRAEKALLSFDEGRRIAFIDHLVAAFPVGDDPFKAEFSFHRRTEGTRGPARTDVRYPNVSVPLEGCDGNAFSILGRVSAALRKAGVGDAEIAAYRAEAESGDYDHLLRTTMRWVNHDRDEAPSPGMR